MIYMRDIGNRQCRWIEEGGRIRNPICCGVDTHKDTSWCFKHYKKVFRDDIPIRPKAQTGLAKKYINFARKKKRY